MKTARGLGCLLLLGMFAVSTVASRAQTSPLSGFDSIHAPSIESNARTGDFSIPSRFSASRQGVDISGDRANGNAASKVVTVDGHVVVHITRSIEIVGQSGEAGKGPSTLTCDRLEIDVENKHYHASGNVHYTQGARTLAADHADMDEATNQMSLDGNIAIAGAGKSGVAGGFDSLKTASINANSAGGDFSIPGRFQATRQGVEISGDHAHGNTHGNQVTVIGNVVVKMRNRAGTLTCERLDIDGARRVYHAVGNVHYIEPARELTADKADMREATHMLHLEGNVHVTDTSKQKK